MGRAALLLPAVVLVLAAEAVAAGPIYPIYELCSWDLPDLHDGSLEDWENVLPGPSLRQDSFASVPSGCGDCAAVDVEDLAYQVYLAWHARTQTLWVGAERVDDVYINTYPGGEPESMWMHDGIEFMVDGDHSGGQYNGWEIDGYGVEADTKLLTGYQAQQYRMIPESPDGTHIGALTHASAWCASPPWADAGGAAWGPDPTTSVMEAYVTPWDALDWHGPEVSTSSYLAAGRIVGFQISMPDFDVVGTYHAFHTIAGLANTWRTADSFVDGELIRFYEPGQDCEHLWDAVEADSWARIKASLR